MKKIRLLIDLGSIKTGGGAQLATNFLTFMKDYPADVEKVYLLIPELGPLSQHIDRSRYDDVLTYPDSYWKRKLFELTTLRDFVAKNGINVFYTFFGSGIPAPKGVRSIVSVAYPIICYPDSPFWKFLSARLKPRLEILIRLRQRRIRMADKVIAETKVMANRLEKYAKIKSERITISPPSPSSFLEDRTFKPSHQQKIKFLLLSGLERHKNIWRAPAIAHALDDLGFSNFVFSVSATREAFNKAYPECRDHTSTIDRHFEFLGTIPSQNIQSVYDCANILVNLSDLESFSNNYMEAWKSGLPLICSDTDFSRHICRDSAIYVDPHNPKQAATEITFLARSEERQRALVTFGKTYLAELPTIEEKFEQTMNIIRGAI
jgi:glycosyltransferase involved in cell wall biosynthesis